MVIESPALGFLAKPGSGSDLREQVAHIRSSINRRKPQELLGILRVYAARTRRRALPIGTISLDVLSPLGGRAVEITFGEL